MKVGGFWFLTPFSTIFQLYHSIGGGKKEYPEKNKDQLQVTDKFYHKMLYRVHHTMSGIRTQSFSGDRH
jgi:hypothetical protein